MSGLLSVTFCVPFTEIAALRDDWPRVTSKEQQEYLIGRARWASSYWAAANQLYATRDVKGGIMFSGPIMQNCGLACELILKCLLAGAGHSDQSLRKFGHSLTKLYREAESELDIYGFLLAVVEASNSIALPEEIAERLMTQGYTR